MPAAAKIIPDCIEAKSETLLELYQSATPNIAPNLRKCFAAIQRPVSLKDDEGEIIGTTERVELLTISHSGDLLHIWHDETATTGWKSKTVSVGMFEDGVRRRRDGEELKGEIVEIQAFCEKNAFGRHHSVALIHFAEKNSNSHTIVPISYELDEGNWKEIKLPKSASAAMARTRQVAVYRNSRGQHYVYGISTNRGESRPQLFMAYESKSGKWEGITDYIRTTNPEATTFRLMPADDGSDYIFTLVSILDSSITLQDMTPSGRRFQKSRKKRKFALDGSELSDAHVVPLPLKGKSAGFLFHTPGTVDAKTPHQLHYAYLDQSGTLKTTQITGLDHGPGAVDQVMVGRDHRDYSVLFATELSNRRLWVKRQNGFTDDGRAVTFDPWVPLGETATTMVCPRVMPSGPELFLATPSREIVHLAQDPNSTLWHRSTVNEPTPSTAPIDPEGQAFHAVTFTVISKNRPMPKTTVLLTSCVPCTAHINNLARRLDRVRPIELLTDDVGQLTVRLPANDLSAPELTLEAVAVEGDNIQLTANPDARVAPRLSGRESDVTQLTEASLVSHGLIPEAANAKEKAFIVNMVKGINDVQSNKMSKGASASKAEQIFVANFDDPDKPTFEQVDKEPDLFSFAKDIARSWPFSMVGDFINYLKSAAEKATKWVVKVTENAVSYVVKLGKQVVRFAVDATASIAQSFQTILGHIANAFSKVANAAVEIAKKIIRFIARKLGWQDAFELGEIYEELTNQTLSATEKFFADDGTEWLAATTKTLKRHLRTATEQTEQLLVGFNLMEPPGPQSKDISPLSDLMKTISDNAVVTSLLNNTVGRVQKFLEKSLGDFSGEDPHIKKLIDKFSEGLWPKAKEHISSIEGKAIKLVLPNSNGARSLELGNLLQLMQSLMEFAIDATGEILEIMAQCIGAIFRIIRRILNLPISSPLVDFAWKLFGPENKELTLLRLVCAATAYPVTIIYRTLHKDKPDYRALARQIASGQQIFQGLIGSVQALTSQLPFMNELQSIGAAKASGSITEHYAVHIAALFTPDDTVSKRVVNSNLIYVAPSDEQKLEIAQNLEHYQSSDKWKTESRNWITAMEILSRIAEITKIICIVPAMAAKTVKRTLDYVSAGSTPVSGVVKILDNLFSGIGMLGVLPSMVKTALEFALTTIRAEDTKNQHGLPSWLNALSSLIALAQKGYKAIFSVLHVGLSLLTTATPYAHFVVDLIQATNIVLVTMVAGLGNLLKSIDRFSADDKALGESIPKLFSWFFSGLGDVVYTSSDLLSWLGVVALGTSAEGVGVAIGVALILLSTGSAAVAELIYGGAATANIVGGVFRIKRAFAEA